MSRVGKKIIILPAGVTVEIANNLVTVKGPKGTLAMSPHPSTQVALNGSEITVSVEESATKKINALWGLTRALIANMVTGVTEGYRKQLEINGVGFKIALEGKTVVLNVGFTHQVRYPLPPEIEATVEKNVLTISGADKQLVGQVAAEIRQVKKPEPYKGKGIKYTNETVRRKVGKVIKSAG